MRYDQLEGRGHRYAGARTPEIPARHYINFGGSSSSRKDRGTTSQAVTLPGPTPEQTELNKLQLEIAQLQKGQLQQAAADQQAFEASPLAAKQRQLEEAATNTLLSRATGQAPVLSPDQQNYLDTIYNTNLARGENDLTRFAQQQAAGRGMNVTDSPIGNELLRQRGEFGQGLAGQRAASALDLGQAEGAFAQNLAAFRAQLQQQAFQNRLSLAGLNPGFTPFASLLSQERRSQPNMFGTSQGNASMSGFNWGGGGQGSYGSNGWTFGGR